MIRLTRLVLALTFVVTVTALNTSCKKDDGPKQEQSTDFRNYKLFNYSSGSEVEAGGFVIEQLLNGNARITITLNEPFRINNVDFESVINTKNENGDELIFANLGTLNGGTGTLSVSPVVGSGSNLPIKFAELISRSAYYVKILNGANVQATGTIK